MYVREREHVCACLYAIIFRSFILLLHRLGMEATVDWEHKISWSAPSLRPGLLHTETHRYSTNDRVFPRDSWSGGAYITSNAVAHILYVHLSLQCVMHVQYVYYAASADMGYGCVVRNLLGSLAPWNSP